MAFSELFKLLLAYFKGFQQAFYLPHHFLIALSKLFKLANPALKAFSKIFIRLIPLLALLAHFRNAFSHFSRF